MAKRVGVPKVPTAPGDGDPETAARDALARTPTDRPLLLAVSGGADSMAMLHLAARFAAPRIAAVAVFDHATGLHAEAAAALVVRVARGLGVPVAHGRALVAGRTEAAWRDARWAFLRDVARSFNARVITAHTADDQLETIVQRWLRGTGARGLAALAAPSDIVRPLLAVHRAALRAYCEHRGLPFVDDPANEDRRHLRVRLRLDLLPLYEQLQPGFADAMRAIGARAARWRAEVDAWAATFPWQVVALGVGRIDRARVQPLSNEALQLLWPAWCATVGVVLDGPGTTRLVRFTTGDAPAGELQVANGASVVRRGRWLEVRNASVTADYRAAREQCALQVRVGDVWTWPGWRFEPISAQGGETRDHATPETAAQWAAFPRDAVVTLRRWQEGDHVHGAPDGASRGVSRYLSEAGIPRRDRRGWPVIVLDGTVEWVPEVCRGIRAAPSRSGRSDFVWYRCVRAHP